MNQDTKILLGIVGVTVAIIIGAVFFLNRSSETKPVSLSDQQLLVRDDSYKISTESAKVQLVEFADYQCPACGAYHPLIKQLTKEFASSMTFVFRNFPLPQHKNAKPAAYAAEAAGKQGKFWEMHDLIYDKQNDWSEVDNAPEIFTQYATSLQLDTTKFAKDMTDKSIIDKVQRDVDDANTLAVDSTPTFYLNGEKLQPVANYDAFKALITDALQKKPISQVPAPEKVHLHSNFSVVLDGKAIDFTQTKYQSTKEKELDPAVHLHDGVGNVLHVHAPRIALGQFFKSLGMSFTKKCFVLDTKEQYCSTETKLLKMYVNGKVNQQMDAYVPQDLDRILITYGSETESDIQKQMTAVADNACIYSEKCPERGKPPTEDCVGGVGSDCKLE